MLASALRQQALSGRAALATLVAGQPFSFDSSFIRSLSSSAADASAKAASLEPAASAGSTTMWDVRSELGSVYNDLDKASTSGSSKMETMSALLRRHNQSLPKGKLVQGTVLSVGKDEILVDTLFGVSAVPRHEVDTSHVYKSAAGNSSRRSTTDIRPGDVLTLRIIEAFTPYGDSLVAPVQTNAEAERARVWSELQTKMSAKEAVSGRVLNDCPGGYAVGIAGYVALLPYSQATLPTVKKIGEVQYFNIVSMDDARKRIVVADALRRRR